MEQVDESCSLYAGAGFERILGNVLFFGGMGFDLGKRAVSNEGDVLGRIRRTFDLDRSRATDAGMALHSGFLSLGMGDDAALVRAPRGSALVLTCDWFLEGTHFLRAQHPADSVGWKCLARAVSDVAAMGGEPRVFLLSLALPKELARRWLDEFLRGLKRAASAFECVLAGGDTTERREVLINVTVVGAVQAKHALLRSSARIGDIIYVSGRLGEAELGLRLLRDGKKHVNLRDTRLRKHLYPEPRLALGRWLSEQRVASAMMDLSDGLSSDLRSLCVASGVGALVDAGRLPRVSGSDEIGPVTLALHGGDDYELLFTVTKKKARLVPRSIGGVAITAIGEITRAREVMVVNENGRKKALEACGWDPFRGMR